MNYDCDKCLDTGYCDKCGGDGCMDCRYTGECQHCKSENNADELFFIRSAAHERWYHQHQSEYHE